MDYKAFEEKVKAMSAKEIILAMVDSLRNPVTEVDMHTFGYTQGGKCYGCAATNTICKIAGVELPPYLSRKFHQEVYDTRKDSFLFEFETSIDDLRRGDVDNYNLAAEGEGFAAISIDGFDEELPGLDNNYTEEHLQIYEQLAEIQ